MSTGYTHANYLRPGVTAPNPHAPRATENRPAPLHAGARSTGRGLRVGVVDSFGGNFVGRLHFYSRTNFKINPDAAIAEWRQLLSA